MGDFDFIDPKLLSFCLAKQGFYAWGFLDPKAFCRVLDDRAVSKETRARYATDSLGGAVVVALRYGESSEYSESALAWPRETPAAASEQASAAVAKDAPLLLGRFARANWYAELLVRLASACRDLEQTLGMANRRSPGSIDSSYRRLANSGLPEKPLAVAAGLGWIGKNGILIARGTQPLGPAASSAVVLGLLILPETRALLSMESDPKNGSPAALSCGSCANCVKACPAAALSDPGRGAARFERQKCLQHWASMEGPLPSELEKVWGNRLYGCDSCLEACPYFSPDPEARANIGLLGTRLSAKAILRSSDAELRAALKGTALDRKWISLSALRRSASIALRRP